MGGIAVVTGAAGGIGAAAIEAFRAGGWTTVAVDRQPISGRADHCILADIASDAGAGVIARALAELGSVDALVNNAAVQITKPLIETTADDWRRLLDVNVIGAATMIRLAAPLMPTGGAIVNVGSVHSRVTSPGLAAYVASKGAVEAMTRAAALELAPRGIRVNCVMPGAVETPMLRDGLSRGGDTAAAIEAGLEHLACRTPLQRVGRPQDIAEAIFFLSDPARASFITGQTLVVDGGASARLSTE